VATTRLHSDQSVRLRLSKKASEANQPLDTPPVMDTQGLSGKELVIPTSLRALAGAIAWLSGAAAGISAIFYVCGVLVTTANLHMLGLDPLALRYEATFYMHRGGQFLLVTAIDLGKTSFYFFAFGGLLFLAIGAVLPILRRTIMRTRLWRFVDFPNFWKTVAYLSLLALLFQQVATHLTMPQAVNVSDMLYARHDALNFGKAEPTDQIRQWLICGKQVSLEGFFIEYGSQHIFIGLLLAVSWALTRLWRWGFLLTTPFAIIFLISCFLLTFVYGKLVVLNKFPAAIVQFERPTEMTNKKLYLLNKTDNDFIFWEPSGRKVEWVPIRAIAGIEFSASESLSQIALASAEVDKCNPTHH
jgi:hypothetical protein